MLSASSQADPELLKTESNAGGRVSGGHKIVGGKRMLGRNSVPA